MLSLASRDTDPAWEAGHKAEGGPLSGLQAQIDRLAEDYGVQSKTLDAIRMHSTPILSHCENISPMILGFETVHPIFNPSVAWHENKFVFLSRSSSLRKIRDKVSFYASRPHNTINIIHEYDHDLNFISAVQLDDALLRHACPSAKYGVEDCRLFLWKDALWAIGAGISPQGENGLMATQVLFKIVGRSIVDFFEIESPFGRLEKNWIPYVDGERLFIVYSFIPTIVFEFKDGKLRMQFAGEDEVDRYFGIRGGTPFIKWKGGLLGVVHETPTSLDKMYYRHMFIFLDEHLNLIEVGEPWFIRKRGIEFACGLAKSHDRIMMSFGISDRISACCELSPHLIDKWIAA